MKTCNRCNKELKLDMFYKSGAGYYNSICKLCLKEYNREYLELPDDLQYNTNKPWTVSELKYLKEWGGILRFKDLALDLNRSIKSVQNRYYKLRDEGC